MLAKNLWPEDECQQETWYARPPLRSFKEQTDPAQGEQHRADQQNGVLGVTERLTWTPDAYEPRTLCDRLRTHAIIVAPAGREREFRNTSRLAAREGP
jgi:hypothetical protein